MALNPTRVQSALVMEATKKLLKIALIGAPNAGKSTLLNRLIFSDISCVSNKVHTTRKNMLGVYTEGMTQLEFFDSPGVVTKKHLLRHHLEDSLLRDPEEASKKCDLIAVVVDASNLRDSKRLNRTVLAMLKEHPDKTSYLILNKTDLVKSKRLLLDIGSRLTEGHLEGKRVLDQEHIRKMLLNSKFSPQNIKATSRHVIELDKNKAEDEQPTCLDDSENIVGYRNFSQVFSISALQDDGVDQLRERLLGLAKPTEYWAHGPDYLTNESSRDIVHAIIRGKVMDSVDNQIPYVIKYKYLQVKHDALGSLHIDLELVVPKKYMIGKLLGQHGVVIFGIINESRERISQVLACDVKLNITVKSKER
uniref:GTPase Era, mitochondrial n=1 Tax=Aceria tosichella TaxID=561515 RepID=A0A6G1SGJ2_9ACAR